MKKGNFTFIFLTIISISICLCPIVFNGNKNYKSNEIKNFDKVEEISTNINYNDFLQYINNQEINTIYAEFDNQEYSNTLFFTKNNDENIYMTQNPQHETFKKELLENNLNIKAKAEIFDIVDIIPKTNSDNGNEYISLLLSIGIFGLMAFFIIDMSKNMHNNNLGSVKANDELSNKNAKDVKTFKDVGGLKEVKRDLMCVVDFLKNPKKYEESGAKLPRGILLVGPPGTGKTLLAKVIAKEAGVNFLYMNGSDFVEMYVGRGASRVRNLFKEAKKQSPCIIFIDEIDTLCGKRGIERGEHSEDRKTLTALLAEMDGFKGCENVMVIGATNRIEDIDAAALRPGRFTDIYTVPLPETLEERLEIINIYTKNKRFAEDFDKKEFAKDMIGRSPVEIEAVLNDAAIISVQKNLQYINKECIEEAFYKRVMHGHQKDNKETHPEDLKIIAYHEAGHALVAKLCGNSVTKVTILPSTSGAGGVTFTQPNERKIQTKKMLEDKVKELYGGKIAEYLLMNKNWDLTTTGCSNDIERATSILKHMVDAYGMSDNGLINLGVLSKETNQKSTEYIINLSNKLKEETIMLIETHYDLLEKIAQTLLENETIYENEIDSILGLNQED